MVGLVIVSHSHALAEGVRELAQQIGQGKVAVATAGGLDEHTLGTNPERILKAIREVRSPGGVIVLMDLGSAILSAEMALEWLSDQERAGVLLCEAPLVEGAVAAAALIAAGASLQEAAEEARAALTAKQRQLRAEAGDGWKGGPPEPRVGPGHQPQRADQVRSGQAVVPNALGLHARPAAQLVQAASRFESQVRVRNATRDTDFVNARSLNAVALLEARQGDELVIEAVGPDAAHAVEALVALVSSGFGEPAALPEAPPEDAAPGLPEGRARRVFGGIPASPGVALGPAVYLRAERPAIRRVLAEGRAEDELERLDKARQTVARDIEEVARSVRMGLSAYLAEIFEVQRALLNDPELLERVRRAIVEERLTAEAAWDRELTLVVNRYREAASPVLQARGVDVEDVRDRVLGALVGTEQVRAPQLPQAGVLVVYELTPSLAAQLDREQVQAICTGAGGATSHAVILARSMNIPTVVGLGQGILTVAEGTLLGVDARRGVVAVEPDDAARAFLAREREAWLARRRQEEAERYLPAFTQDGRRIEVAANAGSLADARTAQVLGAEGIGLLRTELLFLGRSEPPTEDEQAALYRAIVEAVAPNSVIIRTLDVGGDKPPAYLDLGQEANPFLGLRGVRVSLAYPDLFRTQLRAILRVARAGPVRIMFPMVATEQELEAGLEMLQAARDELRGAGMPEAADAPVQVGIMVEVPSAAVMADRLARTAEFFSIGTNDLTQYVMAAERGNRRVAGLSDPLQPAVLRVMAEVIEAGHNAGRPVGVCGEMAGDVEAVPILLGLGLEEFSTAPASVPRVKAILRQLDSASARTVAREALAARSAEEVRSLVRERFGPIVG